MNTSAPAFPDEPLSCADCWRLQVSLADTRKGKNGQARQSVFGRLAGYEDVNDAERLARDPAMRAIVGGRAHRPAGGLDQPDGPLRDRVAGRPRQPRGAHRPVRRLDRPGAQPPAAGRHHPRHGQLARARPTASRRARPRTATSAAPATTRCSCSTSSATWSAACCGPATSTAPRAGARCWSR